MYEYKILNMDTMRSIDHIDYDTVEAELNELGRQGFELTHVEYPLLYLRK